MYAPGKKAFPFQGMRVDDPIFGDGVSALMAGHSTGVAWTHRATSKTPVQIRLPVV